MAMNVKTFELEGVNIFQVDGEININTSPDLKKVFEKHFSKSCNHKDGTNRSGRHELV